MAVDTQEHSDADGRAPRRPRPPKTGANLAIRYLPHADLTPYDKNPRTHPRGQLDKIKASMRRFGWTNPILIADAGILAGHGRLIVAKELAAEGFTPKYSPAAHLAPTIDLSHLSAAERRAYVLADNRIALDSGWDETLLAGEIAWLEDIGFDLAETGFSDEEVESLLAGTGLPSGKSSTAADPGALAARFGVPPFSVLNAREGWWQDRKRAWISLGIRSELGRGENALELSPQASEPGLNHYRRKKADMTRSGAVAPIQGDPKQNFIRKRGYR